MGPGGIGAGGESGRYCAYCTGLAPPVLARHKFVDCVHRMLAGVPQYAPDALSVLQEELVKREVQMYPPGEVPTAMQREAMVAARPTADGGVCGLLTPLRRCIRRERSVRQPGHPKASGLTLPELRAGEKRSPRTEHILRSGPSPQSTRPPAFGRMRPR